MGKERSGKQIRHLKSEIKRLQAIIKRLKAGSQRDITDELDEIDPDVDLTPCFHCKAGAMIQVQIIDKPYLRCIDCGRTKKI